MTVLIQDKRRPSSSINALHLTNGAWFAVLSIEGMDKLVNTQHTNDPLNVTPATAKKMAVLVAGWCPPTDWVNPQDLRHIIKLQIIEFLLTCNGFRTN